MLEPQPEKTETLSAESMQWQTEHTLPEPLVAELRHLLRGQIFVRNDAEFKPRTSIFNGNVKSPAKCCVVPNSAVDVSNVLKFCVKHGLNPSIKAGGYGTAGWSINGDVVIDLSKLNDIDMEAPLPGGGYAGLRDTPLPSAKGKEKISSGGNILSSGSGVRETILKRRRASDAAASQTELPRNQLVASFLHPGLPSPALRRRVDFDRDVASERPGPVPADVGAGAEEMLRQVSNDSVSSKSSASTAGTTGIALSTSPSTASTAATSADGAPESDNDSEDKKAAADILASAPAYVYDQAGAQSSLAAAAPNVELETPRAEAPTPQFNVRSSDPFSYMSSKKSESSPRPLQTYSQLIYQRGGPAGSSSNQGRSISSDISPSTQSPFLAESSPSSVFMSSNAVPVHDKAFVTFGSGMKQKDIDIYCAAHPLPAFSPNGDFSNVPYHVPLAAHPVGSSVMILGGFGFLSRLHGLSIDALVEAEVVLADGSIVYASANENPDLFWALRGAGPALGVVTRYKAIAYPVPIVFAGNLIYNFHRATAASLIKHFRDCVKAAPRELYANVLLTAGPSDKGSLVVVQLCYVGAGAGEKGKAFLQAIESFTGAHCLLNEVNEKSFLHQQDSVAQILRGKVGRQWFIRSALITSLPDEIIYKTVNEFADTPVGCTWLFELAGGAVADTTDTCLPKEQREAAFTIAAFHQWELEDDDPACVETAEHWIYETLNPVSVGGPLPAFIGRHEPAERVVACYGENWTRLREIKRKYDPNGLFKNSFWPLDVHEDIVEPRSHEPPSP